MDAALEAKMRADMAAEHAKFRAKSLDHPSYPGKTIGDAHDAFAKVSNKANWKMPVSAVIKCDEAEVGFICYAIGFMCGGGADAQPVSAGTYHFTHPGYYAVIGA